MAKKKVGTSQSAPKKASSKKPGVVEPLKAEAAPKAQKRGHGKALLTTAPTVTGYTPTYKAKGATQESITVNGTNFDTTTPPKVDIVDSNDAATWVFQKFISVSSTQLVCRFKVTRKHIHANPGTLTITVTNPDTTSGSANPAAPTTPVNYDEG
jgi:hypothetical protein